MRTILIAFLLALVPASIQAQEIHSDLCLLGCPAGSPSTNDLIIRDVYILSSNDQTKFADWAAYVVTADTLGPTRKRKWKADPALADSETLEPSDYKGAHDALHTDRGHQVPLAALAGTENWAETNYLSNITPQKSALNQGPWKNLEGAVRQLAVHSDVQAVAVMTGPLYERPMPPLPGADEPHRVPSGYWKIVSVVMGENIAVAGFILDQDTPRGANFCRFAVTVDEIERRSALNFFHELDPEMEKKVESDPSELSVFGCQ